MAESNILHEVKSPIVAHWLIAAVCPHNCVYCYGSPRTGRDLMPPGQVEFFVSKLADDGVSHIVLTGGDSYPQGRLLSTVKAAAEVGLFTVLDVDGRRIDEAMLNSLEPYLDCIGFPLDSTDASINDTLRGCSHHSYVTRAIGLSAKRTFSTRVHTVVTRSNIDTLNHIAAYLSTHEVKLWTVHQLSPVPLHSHPISDWFDRSKVSDSELIERIAKLRAEYPNLKIRSLDESGRSNQYLLFTPSGLMYTHPSDGGYSIIGNALKLPVRELAASAQIDITSLALADELDYLIPDGERMANDAFPESTERMNDGLKKGVSGIDIFQPVFRDRVIRGLKISHSILKRARFIRCDLSHTEFYNVDLYRSRFIDCTLYNTTFTASCLVRSDFRSSFLYGIRFPSSDASYSSFELKARVKDLHSAISPDLQRSDSEIKADIYSQIAKIKQESREHRDASHFRYLHKRELRKQLNGVRRLTDYVFGDLLSCYGESPSRVAYVAMALIIVFAIMYLFFGYHLDPQPENILQSLYFSIVVFTTLGFGDITPLWNGSSWMLLIIAIEALTGPLLMALLMVTFVRQRLRE